MERGTDEGTLPSQLGRAEELEVLCFVIHHGTDRWTAPGSLEELLPGWMPGSYRLISRGPGGADLPPDNWRFSSSSWNATRRCGTSWRRPAA